jgi:hypothetical protein
MSKKEIKTEHFDTLNYLDKFTRDYNIDWRLGFGKKLIPITTKNEQEFKGDYYFNDNYVEVKGIYPENPLDSNEKLFIETWSCRKVNNVGWIYKQLNTKYLVMRNKEYIVYIKYEKLRNLWFSIYPNPKNIDDNIYMDNLKNNDLFYYNKTNQYNSSEGYWICLKWFEDNDLVSKKIKSYK